MIGLVLAAGLFTAMDPTNAASQQAHEIHGLLNQWEVRSDRACFGQEIGEAKTLATELRILAAGRARALSNPRYGNVQKHLALKTVYHVAPLAGDTMVTIGEAYLRGGCPDQADEVFRKVLTYDGDIYESYRQRARVGIDDVRAAAR